MIRAQLLSRARASAGMPCCTNDCLLAGLDNDMVSATSLLELCYNEINGMTRIEKKNYMRVKLESSCVNGISTKGYLKLKWCIGTGTRSLVGVCRQRFMWTYDIRATYLTDLCGEVKQGVVNTDGSLNDRSAAPSPDSLSLLAVLARNNGITLTDYQLQSMELPNSVESIATYGWMEFYFDMVGDAIPNSNGEIHLEPCLVKDIYTEYRDCFHLSGQMHLQKTQFCNMLRTCFRHVSIREFKAVTGKCNTCAKLSDLRRKLRDNAGRTHTTLLHWLHRTAYMGERMAYAQKIAQSIQMPSMFLSMISDGMAQNHCILPWLGNLSQLKGLSQHIQGVLQHGRGLTLYRTFHNVGGGANGQIHTFLLSLEDTHRLEGKLPDTVYYQIDGGSENSARSVLLLCELLVIRGLTKKVVLTRLMVGHTHADIDAVFGRLWKSICTSHVLTPAAYQRAIEHALSTPAYRAKVVDIFVVPDYDSFLLSGVDPLFGRYSKTEYTQLVFTCEAVGVSPHFPLGVRTTYRAYCKDEVVEIVSDETSQFGLRPQTAKVSTFPPQTDTQPGGMHIMTHIPQLDCIHPMPFVSGSRAVFDARLISFQNHFKEGSAVFKEWQRWDTDVVPQSDDVYAHIRSRPEHFHVPFLARLFTTSAVDPVDVAPVPSVVREYPVVYTTDSVQWSRRGESRPAMDPHDHPRLSATGTGIPAPKKIRAKRTAAPPTLDADGLPVVKEKRKRTTKVTSGSTVKKTAAGGGIVADRRPKTVFCERAVSLRSAAFDEDGSDYFHDSSEDEAVRQRLHRAALVPHAQSFAKVKGREEYCSDEEGSSRSSNGDEHGNSDDQQFSSEREDSEQETGRGEAGHSDTDDDCGCEWITKCTNFNVPKYGNAALYFGRRFAFNAHHINSDEAPLPQISRDAMRAVGTCKIVSIVRRNGGDSLWFKFYDCDLSRKPPANDSKLWYYIPCKFMMSTDNDVRCMQLMPVYGIEVGPLGLSLEGRNVVKYVGSRRGAQGVIKKFIPKTGVYKVVFANIGEDWNEKTMLKYLRC